MRQTGDDLLRRIQALEQQLNGVVTDISGNQIPQTPVVVSGLPAASDAQFPVFATAAAGNVSADGWYARSMSGDATMNDQGVVSVGANVAGGTAIYGDGSDGDVVFDGSTTVLTLAPSGSVYTLGNDIFVNNMTINTGVTVNTGGFKVFCRGVLTIQSTGILGRPGNNASGTTAGTSRASGSVGGSAAGGNGATNGNGVGSTGSSTSPSIGGNGGNGGGDGTHAGGTHGSVTAPANTFATPLRGLPTALTGLLIPAGSNGSFITGGAGGGGGATTSTGVSGAGGGGGGVVIIAAKTISNSGTITAAGGNASNAASGNAGGGGGGGGGVIYITTNSASVGGTVTVAGGAFGTGVGTGLSGVAGSNGTVITILNGGAGSGSGSFSAGGDLAGTSTYQTIEEAYTTQSQASAATIDFGTARVHRLTLTGNVTITLAGPASSRACGLTLYLIQDGTGSRTVTWPGSVKWPSGTAPTLSTAASSVDIVVLESTDGGTTWYGNLAGKGYA